MAIALDRSGTASGGSGLTSLAVSFGSGSATAGNLLVLGCSNANGNAIFNTPSGWTLVQVADNAAGNMASVMFWRVAAGGETGETVTWTNNTGSAGVFAWIAEWSGFGGTVTLQASAEDNSDLSTVVLTWDTGAASNTTSVSLCVAAFHTDNDDTSDGGGTRTYTVGYAEVIASSNGARPGGFIATRETSSIASQACNLLVVDTGDEGHGIIGIFGLAAASIAGPLEGGRLVHSGGLQRRLAA